MGSPGELLGLRWQDVDFEEDTLQLNKTLQRVDGQLVLDDTKTEASDSTVPLPAITKRALRAHRDQQERERAVAREVWSNEHGLVFTTEIGTPIDPRNFNRHFAATRNRAELPNVRLHDMRHTVVSLLLALKTPPHVVQAIARHADIDVTMTIYAHTDLAAMREALAQIDWENA
ncbi:MAG: site-specific integrase [Actinomycetota bacterium]|nr:site-specific integrase [Actinomycetota bacterium]